LPILNYGKVKKFASQPDVKNPMYGKMGRYDVGDAVVKTNMIYNSEGSYQQGVFITTLKQPLSGFGAEVVFNRTSIALNRASVFKIISNTGRVLYVEMTWHTTRTNAKELQHKSTDEKMNSFSFATVDANTISLSVNGQTIAQYSLAEFGQLKTIEADSPTGQIELHSFEVYSQ